MQTSRELVYRAIEGRGPDRIPLWIDFDKAPGNYAITKEIQYSSDILCAGCQDPDFTPLGEGYTWLGYKMETFGETFGEVVNPPLADWENFESWKAALPDFSKESCFEEARRLRKEYPDKFLLGGTCLMMEELMNLRGYANYMVDLYEEEENLNALIDVIYEKATQMVDGFAAAGMDAIGVCEDWGLQYTPLMSYSMWEKYFRTKMQAFVDHVHAKGMKYILHSCGHITYLMDTFAEMGIDALQLDQQMNMGLDVLQKWQGTFCFCCPTDIQHSADMPYDEMKRYIQEMKQKLGSEKGGFIYKAYPQPMAIHMTREQLQQEIELMML